MLLQNKKIAIIGGGPGGLTLAKLLQLKGVDVTVYERDLDQTVRQQGSTLDLHEDSGLRALRIAGLMEEFKKRYRPGADRMRITDKNAAILFDDHDSKPLDDFGQLHFRPEIDRVPLRDMLIASLEPGTIHWNSKFTELKSSGTGWEIICDNNQPAYADIVIAADGANSRVRKYINDIKPIYSGITMIEGNIYNAAQNAPKLWELTKGGKVFTLGNRKTLILSAKGEGSLSFCTGTKEDGNWATDSGIDFNDQKQIFEWFRQRFADWSDIWHELFASSEIYYIPRPQYHYPLDQSWITKENITMIGDAAHRMPPYAGEGVNQAMQDALELYETLCEQEFTTIEAAIASFEKKMCERASVVTNETLRNTEIMHAEDGLENMLQFFSQQPEA